MPPLKETSQHQTVSFNYIALLDDHGAAIHCGVQFVPFYGSHISMYVIKGLAVNIHVGCHVLTCMDKICTGIAMVHTPKTSLHCMCLFMLIIY